MDVTKFTFYTCISLYEKFLNSILGLPLAHYAYYNLKHTKYENINYLINYKLINDGNFL